ncbi:MAG: leucine-rich repeat protein [Prevotella sp.]|nr:leucine-rich repeat protein [Prevotella sp.]
MYVYRFNLCLFPDGYTLLKVPREAETFRIREGVWSIDEYAFDGCSRLREVDVPYTVTFFEDGRLAEDACMRHAPEGLRLNLWDWPYPENCVVSDELMEEIANGCYGEQGFVYSRDGKRLLRAAERVEEYWIPETVEKIERLAFLGCTFDTLHVPMSCSWKFRPEAEWPIFGSDRVIGCIVFWEHPYGEQDTEPNPLCVTDSDHIIDDQNVMYTSNGKRLLCARAGFKATEYHVPNGVITICDRAFFFCEQFVTLYIPPSVLAMGEELFGDAGGEIVRQ